MLRVRLFDNRGFTTDRYLLLITKNGNTTDWYSMSKDANMPSGVNMYLGNDLPDPIENDAPIGECLMDIELEEGVLIAITRTILGHALPTKGD